MTIKLLYNPFLYPRYPKLALQHDKHTFEWCGDPATMVGHIVPSSKGGPAACEPARFVRRLQQQTREPFGDVVLAR